MQRVASIYTPKRRRPKSSLSQKSNNFGTPEPTNRRPKTANPVKSSEFPAPSEFSCDCEGITTFEENTGAPTSTEKFQDATLTENQKLIALQETPNCPKPPDESSANTSSKLSTNKKSVIAKPKLEKLEPKSDSRKNTSRVSSRTVSKNLEQIQDDKSARHRQRVKNESANKKRISKEGSLKGAPKPIKKQIAVSVTEKQKSEIKLPEVDGLSEQNLRNSKSDHQENGGGSNQNILASSTSESKVYPGLKRTSSITLSKSETMIADQENGRNPASISDSALATSLIPEAKDRDQIKSSIDFAIPNTSSTQVSNDIDTLSKVYNANASISRSSAPGSIKKSQSVGNAAGGSKSDMSKALSSESVRNGQRNDKIDLTDSKPVLDNFLNMAAKPSIIDSFRKSNSISRFFKSASTVSIDSTKIRSGSANDIDTLSKSYDAKSFSNSNSSNAGKMSTGEEIINVVAHDRFEAKKILESESNNPHSNSIKSSSNSNLENSLRPNSDLGGARIDAKGNKKISLISKNSAKSKSMSSINGKVGKQKLMTQKSAHIIPTPQANASE